MPVVLGLGALVGSIQGTFHLMGGRLDSFYKEEDEFERKEIIRRTTRVPVEQTVSELGEGRGEPPSPPLLSLSFGGISRVTRFNYALIRIPFKILTIMAHLGIRPPGYEERRRERIKDTYGFEINPVSATVEGSQ